MTDRTLPAKAVDDRRRTMTEAEWRAEGAQLFGADMMAWKFRCPVCKHVAVAKEWHEAGAANMTGFSCIGRTRPSPREAFKKGAGGPCNYAGGGLFRLNPISVTPTDGGEAITMMEFAHD